MPAHRLAAVAAALTLLASALPAAAQAQGEVRMPRAICKSAAYTTTSTISAQDAVSRWSGHVRSMYGQPWSAWSMATGRSQTTTQQAGGTVYIAAGRPCRSLIGLLQN